MGDRLDWNKTGRKRTPKMTVNQGVRGGKIKIKIKMELRGRGRQEEIRDLRLRLSPSGGDPWAMPGGWVVKLRMLQLFTGGAAKASPPLRRGKRGDLPHSGAQSLS
jgi:hypothetical protein